MLIRNTVTDTDDIKKILITLCGDNPIQCDKLNISGIFSKQRVIVVRDLHFEYYNKPPKFKDGNMSLLESVYLKARVKLTDIYELHLLPQRSHEKKCMKLLIPLKLIEASDVSKYKGKSTLIQKQQQDGEPKINQQIITWTFFFDTDIKSLVLEKIAKAEKRKLEMMENLIPYNLQDLTDSYYNIGSQAKPSFMDEVNAEEELDKNLIKLKEVKEYNQFKEKLDKQEEQRQNMIKLSLNLRKMEKGDVVQENAEEDQIQVYPIRDTWKDFWRVYERAAKCIGQKVNKDYLEKQLMLLNELFKAEQQIKAIYQDYINFKLVGWGPERTFYEQFEYYKGVWIKLGNKELNQEFLTNDYLADLMYVLKNSDKIKLRIPPLFLMNYKGFKGIVRIDLPFTSIKSLSKQIYYVKAKQSNFDIELIGKIKQTLHRYEKILNIKYDKYIYQQKTEVDAPLGHDLKIFEYDSKYEESTTNYLQNFYYIINIKGVFPIDYEFQRRSVHPQYWLRPQIIAQYRDFLQSQHKDDCQLLSQCFMYSTHPIQIKQIEERKAIEVSQDFIPIKIKQLMNEFAQINLLMVDSYSLKKYMSEMGINARYLGHMYKETEIPFIQETLEIEMYARIIKNMYYDIVKDMIASEGFFKRELFLKKHKEALHQTMRIHNNLMAQGAIDFLNLVFGIGDETNQFWKIVLEKVKQKYDISFTFPLKCKPGCLLHAVLWHCKFIVKFELDIKLFEADKPFDKSKNWIDFRLESKSFSFPSLQINKILKKLSVIDDRMGTDDLEKQVIALLKLELLRNSTCFGLDFHTQMTLAKLNNKVPQLEKSVRQSSFHPCQLPYYFTNKSHDNFKRALDIINFSLPSNHPLFISLYDVYSSEFENELMQKATLLSAIKGLGEFHPRTTELYSKYYREGAQKFEVKAKRSEQTEAALIISEQLVEQGKFERCLNFTFERIKMRKEITSSRTNDLRLYLKILKNGLLSSVKTRFFNRGLLIAEEYSEMINTYKIRTFEDHEFLLRNALIIKLSLTKQKYYIYKLVLLAVKIQQQHETGLKTNENGLKLPRSQEQRSRILMAIMNEYYLRQTHSKWIQYILFTLKRGEPYFKHLSDLFNNYKYHIKNFNMQEFQDALGYLDVLVRFFGQQLFYDALYQVS